MDRAEYIEHLKKRVQEGGIEAIQLEIQEAIDKEGPVHEVEYHECPGYGIRVGRCGTLTDERWTLCSTCRGYKKSFKQSQRRV